jgi:cbb3-type cytochrome oxidase maturation protein
MNVLFFLIPLALLLGGVALAGFLYATLTGQMDDLVTPAHRALLDDSERKQHADRDQ